MKTIHLFLTVVGFAAAFAIIGGFTAQFGLDIPRFFQPALMLDAGGLGWADILLSSFTFWAFLAAESKRLGIKHVWLFVVLNLCVGLCPALPLFLYLREARLTAPA
jgi:Terpene cyclase DEP1